MPSRQGTAGGKTKIAFGTDIGNVAASKSGTKADGEDIYKAAIEGFYSFLILFHLEHGLDNFHVISTTITGSWWSEYTKRGRTHKVEAWVVRFVRSVGILDYMPDRNLRLTTERSGPCGKGQAANEAGITHFVDDSMECLWSVMKDRHNALESIISNKGFLVHFVSERRHGDAMWLPDDDECMKRLGMTDSWRQIAIWLGLPYATDTNVWRWLEKQGPPVTRHRESIWNWDPLSP